MNVLLAAARDGCSCRTGFHEIGSGRMIDGDYRRHAETEVTKMYHLWFTVVEGRTIMLCKVDPGASMRLAPATFLHFPCLGSVVHVKEPCPMAVFIPARICADAMRAGSPKAAGQQCCPTALDEV